MARAVCLGRPRSLCRSVEVVEVRVAAAADRRVAAARLRAEGWAGQSGGSLGYETLRMRDAWCGACQEA